MCNLLFVPPIAVMVLVLAAPALAQNAAPCPYLMETIEARAKKIAAAQDRVLDLVAKGVGEADALQGKVCEAARGVIADADELVAFAEKRRERCETPEALGALDATIALASVNTARDLAKTYCVDRFDR